MRAPQERHKLARILWGDKGDIGNCYRNDADGGEGKAADVDVAEGWIPPNSKPQVRGKGIHG